jgi:hypothetical protein
VEVSFTPAFEAVGTGVVGASSGVFFTCTAISRIRDETNHRYRYPPIIGNDRPAGVKSKTEFRPS